MNDDPERRVSDEERTTSPRQNQGAPLDGSTSGTIGGGGRETGGPTERPDPPEIPPADPDDAASGRMAPDPLAATTPPDPTKTVRTDTSRR